MEDSSEPQESGFQTLPTRNARTAAVTLSLPLDPRGQEIPSVG